MSDVAAATVKPDRETESTRGRASTALPRELLRLQAGGAAISGALIAASVATVSPWGADIYTFAPTAALCGIVAAFAGAQHRFGALAKARGWQLIGGVSLGLGSLVLVISLGMHDRQFTPLAALFAGLAYFAAMGVQPLVAAGRSASWHVPVQGPTSRMARLGAITFALAFGGLIAIMGAPRGQDAAQLLLLLIVLAVTLPFPWGLARAARSWRAPQWSGFAIAIGSMTLVALCGPIVGSVAGPLSIAAGLFAAAALLVGALLPDRTRPAPAVA